MHIHTYIYIYIYTRRGGRPGRRRGAQGPLYNNDDNNNNNSNLNNDNDNDNNNATCLTLLNTTCLTRVFFKSDE